MNYSEYFEEPNIGFINYDFLSPAIHFEKVILDLSDILKYYDHLFKSTWSNFFDLEHLHQKNKKQQLILLMDKFILAQHELKILSRVLCFSKNSSMLGCGFLGGRNRSSILAYYCSLLAPLSSIESDGVFLNH